MTTSPRDYLGSGGGSDAEVQVLDADRVARLERAVARVTHRRRADAVDVTGRTGQRVGLSGRREHVGQQQGVAAAVPAAATHDRPLLGALPVPLDDEPL